MFPLNSTSILTVMAWLLCAGLQAQSTSIADGVWSDNSNWNIGSPGNNTSMDAHLFHQQQTNNSLTINDSLIIHADAQLTIKEGKSLNVLPDGVLIIYGDLLSNNCFVKIKSGGTVIIKDDGRYGDGDVSNPDDAIGGRFQINVGGVLIIENGGELFMSGDASIKNGSDLVVVDGVISLPSTSSNFSNTGEVSGDGSLNVSGGFSSSGSIELTQNGSISSGDFANGSIWSNGVSPNDTLVANVNGAHVVSLSQNEAVSALVVENGGTLNLGSDTLSVTNGTIYMDGNFNPEDGAVNYSSDSTQVVAGLNYHDLILSGGEKLLSADLVTTGSLTIKAGTILNMGEDSGRVITVLADLLVDGELLAYDSEFKFSGTVAQSLRAASPLVLHKITLDNGAGLTIVEARLSISNLVNIQQGTLNTNDSLVLLSNETKTAAVGPIFNGQVAGEVSVQRFITSSAASWRFLGAPIADFTFADLSDDFLVTGIAGSAYPNHNFTSVYYYDEPTTGESNGGYMVPLDMNQSLIPGLGYQAYVYVDGPALTMDHRGVINQGDFSFPVTYTDHPMLGGPSEGWNMLANPYPSSIDWNAVDWSKSNIDDALYIWNPELGQYASYVGGVGVNGGSQYIASGQGFWVKASGNSPVLTANESCKSTQEPVFMKTSPTVPCVRLKMASQSGQDEIVIRLDEAASLGFDSGVDAFDLPAANMASLDAYVSDLNDGRFSINAVSELDLEQGVPFNVVVAIPSAVSIELRTSNLATNYTCFQILDAHTGESFQVNEGGFIDVGSVNDNRDFILKACPTARNTSSHAEQYTSQQPLIAFPNPTSTDVKLAFATNWTLYNIYGMQIASGHESVIPLNNYPNGVYHLVAAEGSAILIKK